MYKIKVLHEAYEDTEIQYQPGNHLLSILQGAGVLADVPCGGRGTCGKCKVKVLDGVLPQVSDTETALLSEHELAGNIRLACLVYPQKDLVVRLQDKEKGHKVLTDGYLPEFTLNPAVSRQSFVLPNTDIYNQRPLDERFMKITGANHITFEALRSLPLNSGYDSFTAHCYQDTLLAIEQGTADLEAFGLAIDIGTTTVVVSLVDLRSGKELAVRSDINAQKEYGLDVLTRITYVIENRQDGLNALHTAIIALLNKIIEELCNEAGVNNGKIYDVAVAANNTMLHILLGVSPETIGQAPFAPVFRSARTLSAKQLGLNVFESARLYCMPSVSSYIGADVVAGVYICGLHRKTENVLFIDIGTNGEIVLAHGGKLLCCSCAAGPALEGMNIRCGMRASNGAIEDITISNKGVDLKVIGCSKPVGLCGSGIIAAISELARVGLITKSGRIEKSQAFSKDDFRLSLLAVFDGKPAIKLADNVFITQTDIRQVQLAKGAIISGFYALLNHVGIAMGDLDRILVAGQFGFHISAKSLIGCGILPRDLADRITYIGNSSKAGAYLALVSRTARNEMELIAENMKYLELSAISEYDSLFARCLTFADIDFRLI